MRTPHPMHALTHAHAPPCTQAAAAAAARTERLWADVPYQRLCRANSACLKKLLRTAGCPPGLRPDVWFHISSGAALAADAPPYSMLTRGGYSALARHRGHAPPPAAAPAEHPSAAPDALAATAEGVAAAVQAGRPIGRSSIRSAISGDAWIAIREETAPRCLPKALGDRVMALQGGPAALQRMLVAYAAYNPAPGERSSLGHFFLPLKKTLGGCREDFFFLCFAWNLFAG